MVYSKSMKLVAHNLSSKTKGEKKSKTTTITKKVP